MLYISRFVGAKQFGLCNSDDDVEQIISCKQLEDIVLRQGVAVGGITTEPWGSGKRISLVTVHQVKFTKKQAKFKAILGVDVRVFKGIITSIEWTEAPNYRYRTIRLSDFGVACSAKILHAMAVKYSRTFMIHANMTIVLDDKLDCDPKAFKYAHHVDVVFDLREVSNEKIARTFYTNYLNQNLADGQLNGFVMDRPERLDYWIGMKVVNYGLSYNPNGNHISDYVHDEKTAIAKMYKKYRNEFLSLPKKFSFELRPDDSNHSIKTSVTNQLNFFLHNRPDILTSQDFDLLWHAYNINNDIPSIRIILEYDTEKGIPAPLRRLRNYLAFVDRPEEFKKVFVDLYHKILDQLLCKARDNGWIVL